MLLKDDRIKYSAGTSHSDMVDEMEEENKKYYQEVQEGKHDKELREALRVELKKGNKEGYNVFEDGLKRYNSGDKLAKVRMDRARKIMKEEQDRDIRLLNPDEQDFLQQMEIFMDDPNKRKERNTGGSMLKPDYLDLDKDGNKTEPMKEAVKDKDRKNVAEGGSMDDQMLMMMTPPMESEMKDDDDMEKDYTRFIMDEALSEEEEDMLVSKLEQDEELQMLFDKVIDVAQEFAGSGPVDGPGTGVSDDIPARLSDGEFVFTAKAVEEIGEDALMSMMKEAEASADGRQQVALGGILGMQEENKKDQAGNIIDSDIADDEIRKGMLSTNPRLK